MVALLFYVLILGVICWVISALPIPDPFRTIAYAIVVIMLLVLLYNTVAGGGQISLPTR